jgi:DMSO/TMAO reductase YedYZ molybdopterin-dependent catalytic subunit
LPLAGFALAPDEELVPFADYSGDFREDAQADNPRVKSLDLRKLSSFATPAGEFFVFHQTRTPQVDAAKWRLRIGGFVKHAVELSLEDILKRNDRRETAVTIECSGNSGDPRIMNGLVSNAFWSGVPLAKLLEESSLQPEAREVVFLGADSEDDQKFEAGNVGFASPHGWSLFVADALAPHNLLAFTMNGKPLTPEHGFPLRLVMPGWYGMSHIKWLTRIEVIDRHYEGRQMARNYQSLRAVKTPEGPVWLDTSIARNNLKSIVARVIRRRNGHGFEYQIAGAAWGGTSKIERVEVRIDGGSWLPAVIDQRDGDAAWLLWSVPWRDPARGEHTVVSRAVNARGEIQPTRDELRQMLISNREDNSQWPRRLVIP